ncbi:MAG: thioredoxin [Candidatus Marinimicrobia bacterium]|nr:thioredoxin [Candidatus Neomarinimicrobiota bacterium]
MTEQKDYTVKLTDTNWDEEIHKESGLVVVDVWAPWCAPCRVIGPVVNELARDYSSRVKIGKLNADENIKASQLRVTGIPTILFLKNGKEVDRLIGAAPKEHLIAKIEYHLVSEGYHGQA